MPQGKYFSFRITVCSSSRTVLVVITITCLMLLQPARLCLAQPSSINQKRQQAAQVQAEIDQMDESLDIAVERYNVAREKLNQIEQAIEENRAKLAKTNEELRKSQDTFNKRLASIYKQGPMTVLPVIFNAQDFNSFLAQLSWLTKIANQDSELIKKIQRLKGEIEQTELKLEKDKEDQLVLTNGLKSQKNSIESQVSQKQNFLNGINNEITQVLREEEERQRQTQAAALRQVQQSQRASSASSPGSSPPKGGGGGSVVSIALSLLGVPYVYGGANPSTGLDCSGLTMYCYARVGISLPHSSAMQYNRGAKVSYNSLQPGDLVFFGSPIHHVGMYIGGGNYIHAPKPGDVVKISSLAARSDFAGACRP